MEDEVILISIKVSEEDVQKKMLAARQAIVLLRKEKSALEKEFKEGVVNAEEYAKSMQSIERQLESAGKELSAGKKTLSDYARTQKAASGSMEQMRAALSLLNAEYVKLPKAEREAASGTALRDHIRELSDELKDLEKDLGQNSRNVGNYVKDINIAGVRIGDVAEKVEYGKGAFDAITTAVKGTRLGMLALVAIPIVAALVAVVAVLSRTQGFMDKVAQVTKGAELAFDQFTNGISRAVDIVRDSFSSWDKFTNLFPRLIGNLKETKTNMIDAANAGMQIAASLQQLEGQEIALGVAQAKNRADIEKYKKLSEDTTKSNALRSAAAKKAYDLENSTMQQAIKLQKQRFDLAQREFNNSRRNRSDQAKLAEEQKKLYEIEEESVGRQTELQNQLNTIRQEGITKAKESAALAAQEAIAEAERALIMARRRGEDTLKIEEEIILRRARAEKLAVEKGVQQRKLIDLKANQEILERRIQHAKELADATSAIERARISEAKASAVALSIELENLEIRESKRQEKDKLRQLKDDYKLRKISKAQYEAEVSDIERNADLERQNISKQFAAERINRATELAKLTIQTELDTTDQYLEIRRNQATAVINIEEKQQLDLLALQELSQKEYDTRAAAIAADAEKKRRDVYRQILADERADRRSVIEARLAETREGSDKEFQERKRLLKIDLESELAQTELGEKQKAEIRAKYRRAERDLTKQHTQDIIDQTVAALGQATSTLSTMIDASVTRQNAALDNQYTSVLNSAALSSEAREKIEREYQKKKDKIEKDAAERRRKIASIENVINTAVSVQKAFATAGPIVGAILAALALAKGIAQQQIIDNAKFARGGVVDGPSHAQGGVKFRVGNRVLELEGGEAVINRRSTAKYYQQLSAMNADSGWGKPFARTSTKPPVFNVAYAISKPITPMFALGGITPTSVASIDQRQLANTIKQSVSEAVVEGMQGVNIYTAITDVRRADKKYTDAVAQGVV